MPSGGHKEAVADPEAAPEGIRLSSLGDTSLLRRAEQIRGPYGCSQSVDGMYSAVCEELLVDAPGEIVTFDAGLKRRTSRRAREVNVCLRLPREDKNPSRLLRAPLPVHSAVPRLCAFPHASAAS